MYQRDDSPANPPGQFPVEVSPSCEEKSPGQSTYLVIGLIILVLLIAAGFGLKSFLSGSKTTESSNASAVANCSEMSKTEMDPVEVSEPTPWYKSPVKLGAAVTAAAGVCGAGYAAKKYLDGKKDGDSTSLWPFSAATTAIGGVVTAACSVGAGLYAKSKGWFPFSNEDAASKRLDTNVGDTNNNSTIPNVDLNDLPPIDGIADRAMSTIAKAKHSLANPAHDRSDTINGTRAFKATDPSGHRATSAPTNVRRDSNLFNRDGEVNLDGLENRLNELHTATGPTRGLGADIKMTAKLLATRRGSAAKPSNIDPEFDPVQWKRKFDSDRKKRQAREKRQVNDLRKRMKALRENMPDIPPSFSRSHSGRSSRPGTGRDRSSMAPSNRPAPRDHRVPRKVFQ